MDLDELKRFPDVDGPSLPASDAADRLILDEAAPHLADAPPGSVSVLDDAYGALTIGSVTIGSGATDVRVHQDLLTGQRALAANADRLGVGGIHPLGFAPEVVDGARVVLMRLPRSLDRLAEVSALIAATADPGVVVVAGGRIKHMSTQMNEVLRGSFGRVDVSHARQKSRVLFARAPRREAATELLASWPRSETHDGLTVVAHGGVFAGARIDIGTRLLLEVLTDAVPVASTAVDLACGNGVVGAALALARPAVTVTATDRSAAAVRSARATADANGVADRVDVVQADGLESVGSGSQELIALNPPFHDDAALSTGIAHHLFAEAARTLARGGELWCVWNSHLRYRGSLERIVGPTRQVARNAKFTVTASVRR
ncbi:class I SAM-dependent methyltransferase [Gordonia liuliyuniae]|uniref:Methyltransferase n=1 Tax=Gordonia liuliyuniae TaxID=2911517 RepID=A0ABS9IPZ1_9ACTN|nr:methyltransferase [Gordonia liuliyuniae]MCF8587624.1 methyltransferase [Gordonia liuliyuniae]